MSLASIMVPIPIARCRKKKLDFGLELGAAFPLNILYLVLRVMAVLYSSGLGLLIQLRKQKCNAIMYYIGNMYRKVIGILSIFGK